MYNTLRTIHYVQYTMYNTLCYILRSFQLICEEKVRAMVSVTEDFETKQVGLTKQV